MSYRFVYDYTNILAAFDPAMEPGQRPVAPNQLADLVQLQQDVFDRSAQAYANVLTWDVSGVAGADLVDGPVAAAGEVLVALAFQLHQDDGSRNISLGMVEISTGLYIAWWGNPSAGTSATQKLTLPTPHALPPGWGFRGNAETNIGGGILQTQGAYVSIPVGHRIWTPS